MGARTEFVWTALDYIGEAGIGATARVKLNVPFYIAQFPWVVSWCGDIDLIGHQKAQSLARDVVWGLSPLEILVPRSIPDGQKEFISPWRWRDEMPSWTWPDAGAKPLAVRLYTAGDRVELFLNDTSVGSKSVLAKDQTIADLLVPYSPGTLEAVAYRGSKELARKRLQTVGAAKRLRLAPERSTGGADRTGLTYVGIDVLDAAGWIVPDAEHSVRLV